MKTVLFYDTETSGLPLFSEPSEDPRQPHIVQLGALLFDLDERRELQVLDVTIRPDGWTIPDEVAAVHGITTERALAEGIPEVEAVERFMSMWRGEASEPALVPRIAHNETFDARIVRIGLKRFMGDAAADHWKAGQAECTARMSTPIVKMPPTGRMKAAGRNHFKTPKLIEAHEHFFGTGFEGAHSALADVRACVAIYFAMLDLQRVAA